MPNWCENFVDITGSKKDIAALREWAGDKFQFGRMIPLPQELATEMVGDTPANTIVIMDEKTKTFHSYFNSCKNKPKSKKDVWENKERNNLLVATQKGYKPCKKCYPKGTPKMDFSIEESARRVKLYGYDNWYDWCIANWGTKWDNTNESHIEWNKNNVNMYLWTAWSPPEGIYNAIVKKFPKLKIKWHYTEGGNCFSGNFDTGEEFGYPDCECGKCEKCKSYWWRDS